MKQYNPSTQPYTASLKNEKKEPFFEPSISNKRSAGRWTERTRLKWYFPVNEGRFFLAISGIDSTMLQELLVFLSLRCHENLQGCKTQTLQDLLDTEDVYAENLALNVQPFTSIDTGHPSSDETLERPGFLLEVDKKIEENLCNEGFRCSDLARLLCCCEMQLYRKIKQLAKLSPANYVRRYRLRRSLRNLQETDLPISQICLNVGFRSLEYFSRSFKREFGVCPSVFRSGQNVEIVQTNV